MFSTDMKKAWEDSEEIGLGVNNLNVSFRKGIYHSSLIFYFRNQARNPEKQIPCLSSHLLLVAFHPDLFMQFSFVWFSLWFETC